MKAYRVILDVTTTAGEWGSPYYLDQAIRDGLANDGNFNVVLLNILPAEVRQFVAVHENAQPLDVRHSTVIRREEEARNAISASE